MKNFINQNWGIFFALLCYFIIGSNLLEHYRYQINPDGICYISIAQKYIAGDFINAINGYWGPMISWCLMPFLMFSPDALLMAKVLALILGGISIYLVNILSTQFNLNLAVRIPVLICSSVVLLSFAYSVITPDLLLTAVLLFYLSIIFNKNYSSKTIYGLFCGILGAIAYLSKSFALPFFICHFALMTFFLYNKTTEKEIKKKVLLNFISGMAVFLLISGIWIGLLTYKYGEFTFSKAGSLNYRSVIDPTLKGRELLAFKGGFREPPNSTAVSNVEEPVYPAELIEKNSPQNSVQTPFLIRQSNVVWGNLKRIFTDLMKYSFFSLFILMGYFLFFLKKGRLKEIQDEILFPFATVGLMALGYSLVHVQPRYVWLIYVLFILMGGYLLKLIHSNNFFTTIRQIAVSSIFILCFVIPACGQLQRYYNMQKNIYLLSDFLKTGISPSRKIASNGEWANTLYVSYHLGCQYYGEQEADIAESRLKQELEKYKIDYYFFWDQNSNYYSFLNNCPEITGGRIQALRIYCLKKN
jgi:hypothetical protein